MADEVSLSILRTVNVSTMTPLYEAETPDAPGLISQKLDFLLAPPSSHYSHTSTNPYVRDVLNIPTPDRYTHTSAMVHVCGCLGILASVGYTRTSANPHACDVSDIPTPRPLYPYLRNDSHSRLFGDSQTRPAFPTGTLAASTGTNSISAYVHNHLRIAAKASP